MFRNSTHMYPHVRLLEDVARGFSHPVAAFVKTGHALSGSTLISSNSIAGACLWA